MNTSTLLARAQLGLSILLIAGYFGLLLLAGLKLIDGSYVKELTPFIGIVVYYWFQRQRPTSADDPSVPITPDNPASKEKT